MIDGSYKITFALAPTPSKKSFSNGEEIVKPGVEIIVTYSVNKNDERKISKISLQKNYETYLRTPLYVQLKDIVNACTFFP